MERERGTYNINVYYLLRLFIVFPDKQQTRLASLESIIQRLKFPRSRLCLEYMIHSWF